MRWGVRGCACGRACGEMLLLFLAEGSYPFWILHEYSVPTGLPILIPMDVTVGSHCIDTFQKTGTNRFLSQHRPKRERGLAENPALVFRGQEGEILLGQVDLVLEAAIIGGGKVRAPHQAASAEAINEASEELPGSALSPSRHVQVHARKLQVEIRKAYQFEEWLDGVVGRAGTEARHGQMVKRHRDVRETFEHGAYAWDLMKECHDADRDAERGRALPYGKRARIVEPRAFGFRGSEEADASHAALLHPVGQLIGRVILHRVEDAYAGKAVRILRGAVGGEAVVVLIGGVGLHQHGFVDAGLGVE